MNQELIIQEEGLQGAINTVKDLIADVETIMVKRITAEA